MLEKFGKVTSLEYDKDCCKFLREEIKIEVINGDLTDLKIDDNSFEFLAIAFGRIGGQNIGVKLSEETESKLKTLEYNVEEVIDELQKKLISGDLSIPDGLKRESFIDD